MARANGYTKIAVVVLLLALVVLLQYEYDATKITLPASEAQTHLAVHGAHHRYGFSSGGRIFSVGHTMPEILDIFNKKMEYFTDLAFVNAVGPEDELSRMRSRC